MDFAHPQAAEVDLHNLNSHAAKAALIVWLRFLKFHLQQTGNRNPYGADRRHAYIVTGEKMEICNDKPIHFENVFKIYLGAHILWW